MQHPIILHEVKYHGPHFPLLLAVCVAKATQLGESANPVLKFFSHSGLRVLKQVQQLKGIVVLLLLLLLSVSWKVHSRNLKYFSDLGVIAVAKSYEDVFLLLSKLDLFFFIQMKYIAF